MLAYGYGMHNCFGRLIEPVLNQLFPSGGYICAANKLLIYTTEVSSLTLKQLKYFWELIYINVHITMYYFSLFFLIKSFTLCFRKFYYQNLQRHLLLTFMKPSVSNMEIKNSFQYNSVYVIFFIMKYCWYFLSMYSCKINCRF